MMREEQFQKLMDKLDTLIRIAALNAVREQSIADSIIILSDLGFGNTEIARILGTTPKYVSKVKYESRKEKHRKITKEVEFHPQDLHRILSNSAMFPSAQELVDFANGILQPQPHLLYTNQQDRMVEEIITAFQNSDRMKQALFIQALEHRATARELKDTQFMRFLEAWEKHIRG